MASAVVVIFWVLVFEFHLNFTVVCSVHKAAEVFRASFHTRQSLHLYFLNIICVLFSLFPSAVSHVGVRTM